MQCLNLKNKEVKAAFDEVAKVLNLSLIHI